VEQIANSKIHHKAHLHTKNVAIIATAATATIIILRISVRKIYARPYAKRNRALAFLLFLIIIAASWRGRRLVRLVNYTFIGCEFFHIVHKPHYIYAGNGTEKFFWVKATAS